MAAAAVQAPFRASPAGQPDIGYTPDHDKYLARIKRRQETEKLDKSLPPGFPEKLQSDLVWNGDDLLRHYNWNYVLTEADIEEIEAALRHFKGISTQSRVATSRETDGKRQPLTNH
jgi:hypothetical protein